MKESVMDKKNWLVSEQTFDPARMHAQETVFTIGNGYVGTRGTFEEGHPDAWPMTLIHGVYDDVPVVYTELANAPDWTALNIWVNSERFRLDRGEVLSYQRQLDLQTGILSRQVRWRSPAGQTVDIALERFASLSDPHVLLVRCQITPLDGPAEIEAQAGLLACADNMGVLHWQPLDQDATPHLAWLHARTRHSRIELGMAVGLQAQGGDNCAIQPMNCPACPTLALTFRADRHETVTLDKFVTLYTSRETDRPAQAAQDKLTALPPREEILAAHQSAWQETWQASDVLIEGDDAAQIAVRHSLFQLLIAAPRHDERASIPAKTLSGPGYRGHVFWDTEIFAMPLFTWTQPALARNLLTYRYHTLPGARRKAQANGYQGAMFSWESADSGDEVTPRWVPGPQGEEPGTQRLHRIWCGDIELHITADVAYAVYTYWKISGDDEWMQQYGAEIILDTAVFWGSRAEWHADRNRYEICDVIGPDENHEHVNNNAFTNRMAQWHLQTAMRVWDWLRRVAPHRAADLRQQLGLTQERLTLWQDICDKMTFFYDAESGLIEQFEGFFRLDDINLQDYEPRARSIQAILGIEGANHCQALKQADVLMLLYLLRPSFDLKTLQANWAYYTPRTDHTYGSSLGPAIHAILACELDRPQEAYTHFMRAARVDLDDVRGNTAEGIHAASDGGVWQAAVFGFGGVRITDTGLTAQPCLPPHWTRLRFRLQYRGQWHEFDLRV